jgi:hypothetical protein
MESLYNSLKAMRCQPRGRSVDMNGMVRFKGVLGINLGQDHFPIDGQNLEKVC